MPMRSSLFYAVIGFGVLLVIGIIWWGLHRTHTEPAATATTTAAESATSTPSLTGLSIYTNGDYGFIIMYPAADRVQHTFDVTYHLPATWRVNALPNATGTPLVQITHYTTKSDTTFPRYYEAVVRVGASADPKEVASCTTATSDETAQPTETIHGTSWHVFSFESAGMSQYAKGISYRTVHDGSCIALEEIAAGASYRDNPSAADIPQATLDTKYSELQPIVHSFAFAHP